MDIKTYILTFIAAGARMPDLENFIRYDPAILAYWNRIPLVYCVKSNLNSHELRNRLDPFFPQGGFMVAEMIPHNLDGRLPQEAWQWFYAPPPPKGLGILAEALAEKPRGLFGLGQDLDKKTPPFE